VEKKKELSAPSAQRRRYQEKGISKIVMTGELDSERNQKRRGELGVD